MSDRTDTRAVRRESAQALPANVVHSLDAYIAQRVFSKFYERFPGAPIYTVHDCFMTSSLFANFIPEMYIEAFQELGVPDN